jgi:hypothetical protein
MKAYDESERPRIVLLILTGGVLFTLVLFLGQASWALPDQNPHRQTIPTPFIPTVWIYMPHVAKQYSAITVGSDNSRAWHGTRAHNHSLPYLPLAVRGY